MKSKKITLIVLALGLFTFFACEKVDVTNKSTTPTPVSPKVTNNPSGLGSNPGIPYCAPFSFPPSIQLIGEMQSSQFKSTNFDKETQNAEDFILNQKTTFIPYGSGSLVNIYMKFRNTSSVKQTLIIPGGLMFCPIDTTDQTGVIIQPDTIVIPGNDSASIQLRAYCTNLHKGVPNNTTYKMVGTTLHSDLYKMVEILKNKQKLPQGTKVQSIIWNISDRGGLKPEDITYLNSLP